MQILLESDVRDGDISVKLKMEGFLQSVAASRESALLLDFDGTLAPFRIDPSKVRPWAGVRELLQQIQNAGQTRIVVITGRSAREVERQLSLPTPLEIWGVHGAERLYSDGRLEQEELNSAEQKILVSAGKKLHSVRLERGYRIEEKWNGLVIHWRGASGRSTHDTKKHIVELLRPFGDSPGIQIFEFDGGVELRAGSNKGVAVRQLLRELQTDVPFAYLGDDITDEDAFRALDGRGLTVLVRREWRPSSAQIWLRPPGELRAFLAAWLLAIRK